MQKAATLFGSWKLIQIVPLLKDGQSTGASLILRFPEDRAYVELYFLGYVEFGSIDFLQHFLLEDDVVIDVGANIGYFSLLTSMSVPKGQVHAFEPIPETFRTLRGNLILNAQIKNVVANQLAVTESTGQINIYTFHDLHHGYSSIATFGREDGTPHSVPSCSLDDYAGKLKLPHVDFIKVDVEGAERQVFAGAQEILKHSAPTVMLEVNFESARENGFECRDLLEGLMKVHPYVLYRFPKAWGPLTAMSGPEDIENGDNVVAISPKHVSRVRADLK
jgi:FkbM family methyltransferase